MVPGVPFPAFPYYCLFTMLFQAILVRQKNNLGRKLHPDVLIVGFFFIVIVAQKSYNKANFKGD